MLEQSHPIAKLIREDSRYRLEAYVFVFEALTFAQELFRSDSEGPRKQVATRKRRGDSVSKKRAEDESAEHHVTGQELCEAIRRMALEQYGYMAKTVFNNWGIHGTSDFGEIVFNLIRIGQMRKTERDQREDFNDVYDFDVALKKKYRIHMPE
jgi:uncharacterized repeat protein (TIGR04138 family)